VALEAWGLGRPVLANGRCDVLRGQTIRSRAGLYYDDFPEFAEALFTLTSNRPLHQAFGENGRRFYERHYAWPVIQRKYEDMLGQLSRAGAAPVTLDPLPGWLARRRRTLPPAQQVVDAIAKGPVAYEEPAVTSTAARGPMASPAGPAPRPSPVGGRQAVRSGPHGRGRRPNGTKPDRPQGNRPDRPQGSGRPGPQASGSGGAGNAGPAGGQGGSAGKGGGQKGPRDRQDGRRGQNRQGRQRRPPRRNG
jgi:hypothetical protein